MTVCQVLHHSHPSLHCCLAANLEENEKIKAELAPTKINEPKTPFHAPYSEDEDLDIAPDPEEGWHALHIIQHGQPLYCTCWPQQQHRVMRAVMSRA